MLTAHSCWPNQTTVWYVDGVDGARSKTWAFALYGRQESFSWILYFSTWHSINGDQKNRHGTFHFPDFLSFFIFFFYFIFFLFPFCFAPQLLFASSGGARRVWDGRLVPLNDWHAFADTATACPHATLVSGVFSRVDVVKSRVDFSCQAFFLRTTIADCAHRSFFADLLRNWLTRRDTFQVIIDRCLFVDSRTPFFFFHFFYLFWRNVSTINKLERASTDALSSFQSMSLVMFWPFLAPFFSLSENWFTAATTNTKYFFYLFFSVDSRRAFFFLFFFLFFSFFFFSFFERFAFLFCWHERNYSATCRLDRASTDLLLVIIPDDRSVLSLPGLFFYFSKKKIQADWTWTVRRVTRAGCLDDAAWWFARPCSSDSLLTTSLVGFNSGWLDSTLFGYVGTVSGLFTSSLCWSVSFLHDRLDFAIMEDTTMAVRSVLTFLVPFFHFSKKVREDWAWTIRKATEHGCLMDAARWFGAGPAHLTPTWSMRVGWTTYRVGFNADQVDSTVFGYVAALPPLFAQLFLGSWHEHFADHCPSTMQTGAPTTTVLAWPTQCLI